MRASRRVFALLACLSMYLIERTASAETILLVEDEETSRFAKRVRAELKALGFDVEVMRAEGEPTRASLEDSARTAGAVAALRVRTSRQGVEVWVMDRVTGKTVLREVVTGGADDDTVVALGAVELLRASLLEIEAPAFEPTDVPPTPAVQKLVPPRPPPPEGAFSMVLAPALSLSPGDLGVVPQLDVWARLRAADRFVLGLRLVLPTLPVIVEGTEGRASVTLASASVAGDVLFLDTPKWRGHAGVGVGAVWAHMEGTASQAFVGRGDDVLAALSYLHGGASYRLGSNVRLFGDLTFGVATPRPVVVFGERTVAAWGQPVGTASLGLELGLF